MTDDPTQPTMAELQEADYGEGRDYAYGSPHLTHAGLGRRIEAELHDLVTGIVAERRRRCTRASRRCDHGSRSSVPCTTRRTSRSGASAHTA